MNKRNLYILPKDTELTGEVIANAIKTNEEALATFAKLESYVDDLPSMNRTAPNELLAIHDFAGYIVDVNAGYLVGNPIDYKATDSTNLDTLTENYTTQDISELDSELETDCSMFGQAFEAVYVDEETTVRSAKLSVYNTLVIYDDTFKHNKIAALYYAPKADVNGRAISDQYDVTIFTSTKIEQRSLKNKELTEDPETPDTDHFFGQVPIIHYFNNRRLKGDYEPVISLIDAYNILQSDRVIDREKLVDAILAFYGAKMTPEDMTSIKDNRAIGMPEGSKAEYIVKQIDEADADVLRATIAADIHKFSKTPDLTDATFGNAPSGVSILYKLLAFEQNIKKKERLFAQGLRERLELYCNVMKTQSKIGKINPKDVELVFRRALPKNDFETSQMINNLDGVVDHETLVGQLSFVKDASQVVEKAQAEQPVATNFGTNKVGA